MMLDIQTQAMEIVSVIATNNFFITWLKNFDHTPDKFFIRNRPDHFMLNFYKLRVTLFR